MPLNIQFQKSTPILTHSPSTISDILNSNQKPFQFHSNSSILSGVYHRPFTILTKYSFPQHTTISDLFLPNHASFNSSPLPPQFPIQTIFILDCPFRPIIAHKSQSNILSPPHTTITKAGAAVEKARLDLKNTEHTAMSQIRSLAANLRSSWESLAIARLRAEIAERTYTLTEQGFQQGTVEFLELENTRSKWTESRQQLMERLTLPLRLSENSSEPPPVPRHWTERLKEGDRVFKMVRRSSACKPSIC